MAEKDAKRTTNHDTIKKWIEDRDGKPAKVKGTENTGKSVGLLRIDFPDYDDNDKNLEEISWDEFFNIFDENNLNFLYQEKTEDGKTSRFSKFINKD